MSAPKEISLKPSTTFGTTCIRIERTGGRTISSRPDGGTVVRRLAKNAATRTISVAWCGAAQPTCKLSLGMRCVNMGYFASSHPQLERVPRACLQPCMAEPCASPATHDWTMCTQHRATASSCAWLDRVHPQPPMTGRCTQHPAPASSHAWLDRARRQPPMVGRRYSSRAWLDRARPQPYQALRACLQPCMADSRASPATHDCMCALCRYEPRRTPNSEIGGICSSWKVTRSRTRLH